jgi:hypothetical protein
MVRFSAAIIIIGLAIVVVICQSYHAYAEENSSVSEGSTIFNATDGSYVIRVPSSTKDLHLTTETPGPDNSSFINSAIAVVGAILGGVSGSFFTYFYQNRQDRIKAEDQERKSVQFNSTIRKTIEDELFSYLETIDKINKNSIPLKQILVTADPETYFIQDDQTLANIENEIKSNTDQYRSLPLDVKANAFKESFYAVESAEKMYWDFRLFDSPLGNGQTVKGCFSYHHHYTCRQNRCRALYRSLVELRDHIRIMYSSQSKVRLWRSYHPKYSRFHGDLDSSSIRFCITLKNMPKVNRSYHSLNYLCLLETVLVNP